ncbi:hypothetical protein OAL45_00275 [bacterium]|nr:hypothetical protein [bacterium]MDB4744148.1 hypothetical protein [Verrucomicrobiota bacterium]MDC0317871.1 hypothetical protein [bacterium]
MTEKKSKVCSKCKQEKSLCDFYKDATGKFGVRSQCKKCRNESDAKYFRENSEKVKESTAKYRRENPEKVKERHAKYRRENPEKINAHKRKRYKNDENFRITTLLRSRIWKSLKSQSTKKSKRTLELVGCSRDELWEHLEKQFKDGMIRQNLGKWHVDHIKPCSLFDLTDPEQQKECFNYKNLQPLWAEENRSKGVKW